MRKITAIIILVCASLLCEAQTNFVKNPGFEDYNSCPIRHGTIYYANYWRNPVDSLALGGSDYYNECATYPDAQIPENIAFYQYAHSGKGMVSSGMYYDKTLPPPSSHVPFNCREYAQGHLHSPLSAGKIYCVSFWINLAEAAGYAHNKIGAYLDDGSINTAVDSGSEEINTVIPQIFTDSVIKDTMNWTKIEGSFTAVGNETYITIGNFFTNAATTTFVTNYWLGYQQYSFYLIDDVSVIPIDLNAEAGKDAWVPVGSTVKIGRVGDTTVQGLNCKWYHKGSLIDSGAIISVNAAAAKGIIDTFVVVQTICGIVKSDTVLVKTVGLDFKEVDVENTFKIFPNPSNGSVSISSVIPQESVHAKVFDLLGRVVFQSVLSFFNDQSTIHINTANGFYILELRDENGCVYRQRINIQN